LWILTVSADGAVPLAHRLTDGNTTDDQTHIATWDGLHELTGRADFLCVADCKLCTREQMSHIDGHGGRFVTVLPRSRREDGYLREWAHTHQPQWTEALRPPAKRKGDPDEIWHTTSAPICSSEGHRIVWVHSTQKASNDAEIRQQRIERGLHTLAALNERLYSPNSRLRDRVSIEQAATAALAGAQADRWITPTVHQSTEETLRQETRGRPGKDTRYRKITRTRARRARADRCTRFSSSAPAPTLNSASPTIASRSTPISVTAIAVPFRYEPGPGGRSTARPAAARRRSPAARRR
jgi:transposase